MATLNARATDGRISYVKYIKGHPKFKELKLTIEVGHKDVPVYNQKGQIVKFLKAKDSVGVLKNTELHKVKNAPKKGTYLNGHFLSTSLGFVSIFHIRKPTNKDGNLSYEREAIDIINKGLLYPSNLIVKGKNKTIKLKAAVGAKNVPGTPKADFKIVGAKDQALSFLSHKAGHSPASFQQYAGISEGKINNHPEVKEFVRKVFGIVGDTAQSRQAFHAKIKDPTLIRWAVFGEEYGGSSGVNNVDFLAQGKPKLIPHSNKEDFYLKWETKCLARGEERYLTGDYAPILAVRFSVGRATKAGGYTIKNLRGGIYPAIWVKLRKTSVEII